MEKKRYDSVDFLRGLGIFAMVQIHLGMYLTRFWDKQSVTYAYMIEFGKWAAPLFLLAVGISLAISASRRKEDFWNHTWKRGLFLIVLGLLFINIWQADILHYIGLYIILAYLLMKFYKPIRISTALIVLIAAPLLLTYIDYMSGWQLLAYKLADFWTLNGFFNNLFVNGFYPLFPWLFYPIIGTVIGEYFVDAAEKNKLYFFSILNMIIGIILIFLGKIMTIFWELSFYPATISYVIYYLGISMLIFGAAIWFLDLEELLSKIFKPVTFLGKVALSVYILHVIVGIGYYYFFGGLNMLSLNQVLIYIFGMIFALGAFCYGISKWLGYGPLEYILRKCC